MSLKTKLKQAKPDFEDFTICLDRPLAKEYEKAKEAAQANAQDRMAANPAKDPEVVRLGKLVDEASVTLRIYALPWGEYNELVNQHPAREGVDEQFNSMTFFPAAAKAGAVEVTDKSEIPVHDEDFDALVEQMSDGEFDRLAGAVVVANRSNRSVGIAPLA